MMTKNHSRLIAHLAAVVSIILLSILIYANTLHSPFAFDDEENILENPAIRISDLSFQSLYEAGFNSLLPRRVVPYISFALNYYFGQYHVEGYHIVNIGIHIINGILVYLLAFLVFRHLVSLSIIRISREPDRGDSPFAAYILPLLSSLIFIAHPIQTQSVTYIVQRMTSMTVMFYLAAFICYLYARNSSGRLLKPSLWIACGIFWIFALGCKEISITLPIIILLYEWYFFQNLDPAWLKRNTKFFLLACLILFGIVVAYIGHLPFREIIGSYSARDFTMGERVLTQFRVIVFYVSLLLFPHPSRLNLLHRISTSRSLIEPATTIGSLVLILFLIGLAAVIAKKHRLLSFCIFWFFIHLALESSVIGLEMIFEHRLYLPMVGISMLTAYLFFLIFRQKTAWATALMVGIALFLCVGTISRNRTWQDRAVFLNDVLSKNPLSFRALNNLGTTLAERGDHAGAMRYFERALEIKPKYADAQYNLAVSLEKQNRPDEAMDHYLKALQSIPNHVNSHINLAKLLAAEGKIQDAMAHYMAALHRKPNMAEAHNGAAILFEKQGDLNRAVDHYRKAIKYKPDYADAYNNLGIALAKQGKTEEGINCFHKAVKIAPDQANTYCNMGIAFCGLGDWESAITCFHQALKINPSYIQAQQNLQIALAQKSSAKAPVSFPEEPKNEASFENCDRHSF